MAPLAAALGARFSSWFAAETKQGSALALDVDYLLLAPRLAPRRHLVDAILGTPRYANRLWLVDLPHDVLLRVFGNLQPASLCRLAQVSKSMQHLVDEDVLWRPICGCARAPSLFLDELTCCKEHVRDKHLHRLQCEALLWLIRDEENRRRQRARLRKLKQIFLPLLQSVFVLCLLFWPWEEERRAAGGGKAACGEVCYQYAVWDPQHALSPTVRAAAS